MIFCDLCGARIFGIDVTFDVKLLILIILLQEAQDRQDRHPAQADQGRRPEVVPDKVRRCHSLQQEAVDWSCCSPSSTSVRANRTLLYTNVSLYTSC